MPHYTDTQLDSMYEQSKRDHAQWVGSEIRCLIADIREARAALSASPVAQEPVAYQFRIPALAGKGWSAWTDFSKAQYEKIADGLRTGWRAPSEIEIRKLYTSPPATSAGVGADEIARVCDELAEDGHCGESMSEAMARRQRNVVIHEVKGAILALLSRTSPDKSQT